MEMTPKDTSDIESREDLADFIDRMLPNAYYRKIDALAELYEASIGRFRDTITSFLTHSKAHSVVPKRALLLVKLFAP